MRVIAWFGEFSFRKENLSWQREVAGRWAMASNLTAEQVTPLTLKDSPMIWNLALSGDVPLRIAVS
jgi:hypothetical protein